MIKVSVLIPVYNTQKYIKRCLDSVINQTLEDIEIIIVNDGSKDNSQAIIEEYALKDKRIKYFVQENKGLGETRNKGLELATGEYIAFLDSDDWVDNNYYQIMYEKCKKSNSDLAISSYIKEYATKNTSIKLNIDYDDKITYLKDLLNGSIEGFSWNKLYKRSLIEENNLRFPVRDEFENVEDQYFSIRVSYLANKIEFINDCNVHYFINNNSIVNSYQNNLINDIYRLYNENIIFFEGIENNQIFIDEINNRVIYSIINILMNEFKRDNRKSKLEKIKLIKSLYTYDIFNKCIFEFDLSKYRKIDRIFIFLLKNRLINFLYYIAKFRVYFMSIRNGL